MRDYVETELNGHVRPAHQGQCRHAVQVEGNASTTNAPTGAKLGHPRDAHQGHTAPAQLQECTEVLEISEAVHSMIETHKQIDRFADPLIAEITETWRQRQDMVRAQQKLTLQAKSICRRFTAGDKGEAEKLYQAVTKGKEHELADIASIAVMPLFRAQAPLIETRAAYEKQLAKLGKQLPIAHMADTIKGVNYNTLATIVAEVGNMTAYEKGIAGVWKRAGLAVIDGERQRKKAGEAALIHGYSPDRHAVFWNIGGALIKAQGKIAEDGTDNRLPYRVIYDDRKEYERPRVESDGHAHNRAMRFMVKRLLKDIWQEWKNVA